MLVTVHAKAGARINRVCEGEDGYIVFTTALPMHGEANKAIQKQLAEFLGVARSSVLLQSGARYKQKIFSVPDDVL